MTKTAAKARITAVDACEILDSRGNPTLEVEVFLESGHRGRASVPSGASTGTHEACELRDRDEHRYLGKGVQNAVRHVKQILGPALSQCDAREQAQVDRTLLSLDGTANKSSLGANAILAVSLATARAAATQSGFSLYRYLGGTLCNLLPVPFMNLVNGGVHADSGLQIQEFMIVPWGFSSFSEGLRAGVEVYHHTKQILKQKGLSIGVGDEGGFAPRISDTKNVLEILLAAIEKAGYRPEEDIALALDVAASEFYHSQTRHYHLNGRDCTSEELVAWYLELCRIYPIISIEDGLAEDDWSGWKLLTQSLGTAVQLVGDDLFVTHPARLERGIEEEIANAILIKPNQIGTLTETVDSVRQAQHAGYGTIISHRSGETEDPFIADLAVALVSGQIKTGAPCRGERTSKYNQILRIEQELGTEAQFAGKRPFFPRGQKTGRSFYRPRSTENPS